LGHYSTHNPRMEIGVSVGPRHGFSLLPGYSRTTFTGLVSGLGQIVDYGYTTRTLEGRYNYKLNEPTTLYGYSEIEGTDQTLTGSPDVTIRSRSFGVGLTRTVN